MADIVTPKFRVSYPKLFKADRYGKGTPKFSIVMLFDEKAQQSPKYKALQAAARECMEERWPDPKKRSGLKNPFRKGEEKADTPGYGPGIVFVGARRNEDFGPPEVYDVDGSEIASPNVIYPGCYARAVVNAFWYENEGKGVSFGLSLVQKIADGPPLGAGGGSKREMIEKDALTEDDLEEGSASGSDDWDR